MSESFIESERAKHFQEKHFTIVPNKVFRDLADYCLRTNDHEQSFVALFLYARLLDGIYGNDYETTPSTTKAMMLLANSILLTRKIFPVAIPMPNISLRKYNRRCLTDKRQLNLYPINQKKFQVSYRWKN